jgi:hypothetical protein
MSDKEQLKQVDIIKYVIEEIKNGNLVFSEVKKFQRIIAKQGTLGEEIQTVLADGTIETEPRKIKLDESTGQPDWIVQNVNGPEKWIVTDKVFKKKYELDSESQGLFKPKGGPMLGAQINESITFNPPMWGGDSMNLLAGGYIMMDPNNATDIYGIAEAEFEKTYAPAPEEVYSGINSNWTRNELEYYFAGLDPKTIITLETYLKLSAYIGYIDSLAQKRN